MKVRAPYEHGSVLINGHEYYFQDFVADVPESIGNFLLSRGDYSLILDVVRPIKDANRILFIRGAGLGDVLICTAIVRFIKKHVNPKAKIDWLCGTGEFIGVLQGNKYIDNFYSDKNLPADAHSRYDCLAAIDYAEFKTNESFTQHRIDVFARRIPGLENVTIANKKIDYYIQKHEKEWIKNMRIKKPYVTLTTTTTCYNRVRTSEQDRELCTKLIDAGYNVVLIDKNAKEGFDNRAMDITNYSLRQKTAIISDANCVICPDTGILHLASAVDVPILAYFGAINHKLRVTTEKTKALTYPVECYPCDIYHCNRGRPLCVEGLTSDHIVESLKTHLANVGG